jgi:hypothetical protein
MIRSLCLQLSNARIVIPVVQVKIRIVQIVNMTCQTFSLERHNYRP